jgi:predicted nucleotidyltransferase
MMAQEKHIKQIILETLSSLSVSVSNVILFGSRARKDFKEDSDWDLLIVIDDTVTREIKKEIAHLIRRNLAQENILSDVIIKTKEEIKDLKHRKFSIVRSAFEEGVPI